MKKTLIAMAAVAVAGAALCTGHHQLADVDVGNNNNKTTVATPVIRRLPPQTKW